MYRQKPPRGQCKFIRTCSHFEKLLDGSSRHSNSKLSGSTGTIPSRALIMQGHHGKKSKSGKHGTMVPSWGGGYGKCTGESIWNQQCRNSIEGLGRKRD